jgi:ferritin-like protein
MATEALQEPQQTISKGTHDLHRALLSLSEELEAIDWYQQRADAATDPALREVFLHNRGEEIEHASMLLEWLRRNDPGFGKLLKTLLFSEGPITAVQAAAPPAEQTLGIGSMKGT